MERGDARSADPWVSASLEVPSSGRVATLQPGSSSAPGQRAAAPEVLVAALVAAGVRVRGFEVQNTSLEDRFVALTGEGFDVVR